MQTYLVERVERRCLIVVERDGAGNKNKWLPFTLGTCTSYNVVLLLGHLPA